MKRTTIIITAIAATVVLGLAFAVPVIAHGPGSQGGFGMGYGMHGQGNDMGGGPMMGYGMGGQGNYMGGGGPMMGYGMGRGYGPGANPDCPWNQTSVDKELTVDDVTKTFEQRLARHANPNVKLGEVKAKDDKTITVTIVTKDDSLVRQIEVDRATGRHTPVR